tara:strand:- start:1313 stop:1663 length:351 start_codon:yes stop_codon:yes gene_type:complete
LIKKEDVKKDNFVDAVLKVIREFEKHCGTREQKRALQASLIKILSTHGYESFIGTEIEFVTRQIGKSFLFDVPESRRGPLSKFKGQQIRVVCAERVGNKIRYMVAAVASEASASSL